uniref:Dynein light chain n=1 Tax=Ascaris lumbricoides TaxID=6252 RepID=A0A0M3IUA4_ASCLU
MTDRKAVIKNADMSEDMQQDAIDCATQALEKLVNLVSTSRCFTKFNSPLSHLILTCIMTTFHL